MFHFGSIFFQQDLTKIEWRRNGKKTYFYVGIKFQRNGMEFEWNQNGKCVGEKIGGMEEMEWK